MAGEELAVRVRVEPPHIPGCTSTAAPSPMVKPVRSASNGRLARSGSSFHSVDNARIAANPAMPVKQTGASEPPASTTS